MSDAPFSRHRRADQADGLRRLFAQQRQCLVPLVANPHLDGHAVLLERLASALAEQGATTLVIDAADTSPEPDELIDMDLGACIESLGGAVHYLAARGLPLRHVNARGTSEAWLAAVETLAPRADVLLLHASARDLVRLLGKRSVRPVLMSSAAPGSLTDAYASMKLLSQRSQLMSFDLMVAANDRPRRAQALAERLAHTGDTFLGTVVRGFASVDCRQALTAPLPATLKRLAHDQLNNDDATLPVLAAAQALPVWSASPAAPGALSSLLY